MPFVVWVLVAAGACTEDRPPRLVVLPVEDASTSGSAEASSTPEAGKPATLLTSCKDESKNPVNVRNCAKVSEREGRQLPNGTVCLLPATAALAAGCAHVDTDTTPGENLCCPADVKGALGCKDITATVAGSQTICADLTKTEGKPLERPVDCGGGSDDQAYATDLGCVYTEYKTGRFLMCCPMSVVLAGPP